MGHNFHTEARGQTFLCCQGSKSFREQFLENWENDEKSHFIHLNDFISVLLKLLTFVLDFTVAGKLFHSLRPKNEISFAIIAVSVWQA